MLLLQEVGSDLIIVSLEFVHLIGISNEWLPCSYKLFCQLGQASSIEPPSLTAISIFANKRSYSFLGFSHIRLEVLNDLLSYRYNRYYGGNAVPEFFSSSTSSNCWLMMTWMRLSSFFEALKSSRSIDILDNLIINEMYNFD